jgi:hypothetical protein
MSAIFFYKICTHMYISTIAGKKNWDINVIVLIFNVK